MRSAIEVEKGSGVDGGVESSLWGWFERVCFGACAQGLVCSVALKEGGAAWVHFFFVVCFVCVCCVLIISPSVVGSSLVFFSFWDIFVLCCGFRRMCAHMISSYKKK